MSPSENGVLGVTTDNVRIAGIERLVVERHAGASGQRRHHDPGRAHPPRSRVFVQANVLTRMRHKVFDDAHAGHAMSRRRVSRAGPYPRRSAEEPERDTDRYVSGGTWRGS